MNRLTHPNGLVVEMPDDLETRVTARGFVSVPVNARHLRNPAALQIDVEAATVLGGDRLRTAGGRAVHYTVETADGGSYGPQRTLIAWLPIGGRTITITYRTQTSDDADLDLTGIWAIVDTIALEARN